MMKLQREHVIDLLFTLSLLCVFTVSGLLLVVLGVGVYKDTVVEMESTYSDRTALSYLAKQVRQNDRVDGVQIGEVEGELALILAEESEGEFYYKYIYYYEGYLCELYANESFEPVLTAGQPLIAVDGWNIEANEDDTITFFIYDGEDGDEFSLTLSLRSEE